MNERIKQLAVEAGMIVGEPNGFDMTRLMPKEVKFAQLIVAECEEVLRLVPYNSDRDFGDEAIYQEAIAKHFRS